MSKDVMDVEEVAAYLSIAASTVYKWVEQRRIPYTKLGNLLRFPKVEIDRWLSKRTKQPREDLYDRFVKMATQYHLEKLLEAQGLDLEEMTEDQVVTHLKTALAQLKTSDGDEDGGQ